MRQHHAHVDDSVIAFVDELERIHAQWVQSQQRGLRAFDRADRAESSSSLLTDDDATVVSSLQAVQYQAHVAADFVAANHPPVVAAREHAQLVFALEACRDTLAVLVVRAELGELDETMTAIGRDALDIATSSFDEVLAALMRPRLPDNQLVFTAITTQLAETTVNQPPAWSRPATLAVWIAVALAVSTFVGILLQLLVLSPGSSA